MNIDNLKNTKNAENIWSRLPRPFFVQAPMDDAADSVFRQMLIRCGAPDLFFTEFTNLDGVFSKGKEHIIHRLQYTDAERPIIAQVWGNTPENYFNGAKYIASLGFDGIDINMGCPVKDVVKRGSCSAMIENHELASKIIKATQEGAGNLPVSVKTRIGLKKISTDAWFSFLLEHNLDAITVHGRTVSEMSKVPAHWDEIGKVVTLRDEHYKKNPNHYTYIIGNGDIHTREEGLQKASEYHVNGLMIGRGIFDDIGVFNKTPLHERSWNLHHMLTLLDEHMKLWTETWGEKKNFNVMKKYVKIYIKGFDGASQIREALMRSQTRAEMEEILKGHLESTANED